MSIFDQIKGFKKKGKLKKAADRKLSEKKDPKVKEGSRDIFSAIQGAINKVHAATHGSDDDDDDDDDAWSDDDCRTHFRVLANAATAMCADACLVLFIYEHLYTIYIYIYE